MLNDFGNPAEFAIRFETPGITKDILVPMLLHRKSLPIIFPLKTSKYFLIESQSKQIPAKSQIQIKSNREQEKKLRQHLELILLLPVTN